MNEKHYPLCIYCGHPEVHFERPVAARLARVSVTLIDLCEQEGLITCRIMLHGKKGLSHADVCRLKVIRHLHEDMGLALEAVDFILQYRSRIQALQRRINEMEQHMHRREQAHRIEALALRRRAGQRSGTD